MIRLRFTVFVLLLTASPALYAQRGCFRSPEAPTDVLMLVGGAGMFFGPTVLTRWLARRKHR